MAERRPYPPQGLHTAPTNHTLPHSAPVNRSRPQQTQYTLKVVRVPGGVDKQDLTQLCEMFGPVDVKINPSSKGSYAYLNYRSEQEAASALAYLNGRIVSSERLIVKWHARPPPEQHVQSGQPGAEMCLPGIKPTASSDESDRSAVGVCSPLDHMSHSQTTPLPHRQSPGISPSQPGSPTVKVLIQGKGITSQNLHDIFIQYGTIVGSIIIRSGTPDYAYVNFSSPSEASQALLQRSFSLNGVNIVVKPYSSQRSIPTPSVPSMPKHKDGMQVPQAASIFSISQPASEQFFQMLQGKLSSVIHEFQGRGVTTSHKNGELIIRGPSHEMIQSLVLKMEGFTEKALHLSHSQWNQMMSIPPKGLSKFQEMSEPFETNPNITIIPLGIAREDSLPVIQFVGAVEAVRSAHSYFVATLNKKLQLERVKIAALRELQGDSIARLSEKFQVGIELSDSDVSFNGDPSSVCSARAEMEALSAQFQQINLSRSSPVLSLLSSFRKKLEQHSTKACVVAVSSECPCLCAFSSEDLQQADGISKSGLCELRMVCPIEDVSQRFADDLKRIEMKHSVKIHVAHRELVLRGFVQSEVNSAYEELDFLVKNVVKVRQPLQCPQSIHDYLGVLLFGKENPPQKDVDFLNSLPVQISHDQAQVMISGPISSVRSAEEKVLKYFVPDDLCHESVHFTCNEHYVSQIEKTVLRKLRAEHKFLHIVSECKSESRPNASPQAPRPGRDKSYALSVFSRNKKELEEVCAKLKAIEPCTQNFMIPQQAIRQVENMKNQLEERYCCRIIIRRGQPPTVAIHGLYKKETISCRSEVEDSLIAVEKVFLTGYQFQYLKAKCSKKLERMKETCQKLSLPGTKKAQDFNEQVFIFIQGKSDIVSTTATELRKLVSESEFRAEMFSLTCLERMSRVWEQKWEETADDLQKKYDIAIGFTRQQTFDQSTPETRKRVYNFHVCGPDSGGVAEAKKVFIEQENGETKKETILLQRNVEHRVKDALRSHQLALPPTVRWLPEPNQLTLFVPATATCDLEAAKTDVFNFMENMVVSVEHVPCPDEVVAMVLQAQESIFRKKVMPTARAQQVAVTIQTKPSVSVKVNGPQCGKEVVIPIIKEVLQSFADSIDTYIVNCPPLAAPFLTTENGMQFLLKLRQRHCVVVKDAASLDTTTGNFGNVTLQEVTLSLRGPRSNLACASAELERALQDSIRCEKLDLRFPSETLQGHLLKLACTHKIEVKFEKSNGKTIASLKGVGPHVQTALVEMQKLVIEHMPTEADGMVQPPEEWQPQKRTTELFDLQQGSAEWRRVEGRFAATMSSVHIESIERVQNTWLWEKYVQHKKRMHKKNGGKVNEMELFHGTRSINPRQIYDSEEGFDMRFSAQGMWGEANYFAVNASYSNMYAHTTASGKKQIFLVKVLTGDSYYCASNPSLRMPPEKSSSGQVQLSQIRYDTVTGSTGGSQVYMTYDNQKAYPAYLITYGTTYPSSFF